MNDVQEEKLASAKQNDDFSLEASTESVIINLALLYEFPGYTLRTASWRIQSYEIEAISVRPFTTSIFITTPPRDQSDAIEQ